jgi:hypothetical protein
LICRLILVPFWLDGVRIKAIYIRLVTLVKGNKRHY